MRKRALFRQHFNVILSVLQESGGQSNPREVFFRARSNRARFSERPYDYPSDATIRHAIYRARDYMLKAGLMLPSVRGLWVLSSEGLAQPFLSDEEVDRLVEDIDQLPNEMAERELISPVALTQVDYNLLEKIDQYLQRQQQGSMESVPRELLSEALASDVPDYWQAALYSVSLTGVDAVMNQIQSHAAQRALAKLIASNLFSPAPAAYQRPNPDAVPFSRLVHGSQIWFESYVMAELTRRWKTPPQPLLAMALDEARRIRDALSVGVHASAESGPRESSRLAVIVHGTFATSETWWRPGGSFWTHVKKFWPHVYGGPAPYAWSGANDHGARVVAADELIRWVRYFNPKNLDLIAHSHGGNVCLLAARGGLEIDRLILLGTPIRTEYMLDLRHIKQIANVFSTGDWVQPIGCMPSRRFDGRTLGDCAQVSNWRAQYNGAASSPTHGDLHEPQTWSASSLNQLLV